MCGDVGFLPLPIKILCQGTAGVEFNTAPAHPPAGAPMGASLHGTAQHGTVGPAMEASTGGLAPATAGAPGIKFLVQAGNQPV